MTKELIIHPGEFIADELEARWRTQKRFSEIIKKTPAELNHIITWKRSINADWAMRLSMAFWTSAELRMKFQAKYDLQTLVASKKEETVFKFIKNTADKELAFA